MLVVVFDVESVGLHGPVFAVGAAVVETDKPWPEAVLETYYLACPPTMTGSNPDAEAWVKENVLPHTPPNRQYSYYLTSEFWGFWRKWADKGAKLLADCCWPVEANFLTACVRHDLGKREWQGPYPLLDLAPILWAQGMDPTATFDRLPDELPAHNPLNDARQSARLLYAVLRPQAQQQTEGGRKP